MGRRFKVIKVFEEDFNELEKIKKRYKKLDPDVDIAYHKIFNKILNKWKMEKVLKDKNNKNKKNYDFKFPI